MKKPAVLLALLLLLILVPVSGAGADRQGQIVNGRDADPGSWQFFVALSTKQFKEDPFCGGQLVASSWVLTAAHCVELKLGSFTPGLHRTSELGKLPSMHSDAVFFYSHHRSVLLETPRWDVALVHLRRPSRNPVIGLADQVPRAGARLQAAGFGQWKKGQDPPVLQETTLIRASDTRCQEVYGKSFHRESMFCAGNAPSGVCFGDSGGPLVYRGKLVGISSFTYSWQCGQPGAPAVFARVPSIANWANRIITGKPPPARITGALLDGFSSPYYLSLSMTQRPLKYRLRIRRTGCRPQACRWVRLRASDSLAFFSSGYLHLNPGRCVEVRALATFLSLGGKRSRDRLHKKLCARPLNGQKNLMSDDWSSFGI